ncbi:MAG: membrane or secreted protein [Chitinophagaceae bacterium]|nr:MAG: membrane or secreted protein [Chitinophagaceae bacterium]
MLSILVFGNSFTSRYADLPSTLKGAWQSTDQSGEQVLIFVDNYVTHTSYSLNGKKFLATRGGTCDAAGDKLNIGFEFSTPNKDEVGTKASYSYSIKNNVLTTGMGGKTTTWKRLDDGSGALAGNWQITGRVQNGTMNEMRPGARKTIKILSGTRFQWAAINTETKEFSGTGGGKYSFENGKYTEHIEFFSRDSSRVGASLSFDGAVENGKWIHKGLSSRGEPIHEVWSRPSLK